MGKRWVVSMFGLWVAVTACGGDPGNGTPGPDASVAMPDASVDAHMPATGGALGTGGVTATGGTIDTAPPSLSVHELCASNGGVAIDEALETDDWLELRNDSDQTLQLDGFSIADSAGQPFALPAMDIAPGQVVLLWADDDTEQGPLHLPFKLSSSADEVRLLRGAEMVDFVSYENLGENLSYARLDDGSARGTFATCRYPTPGRDNGDRCAPPTLPDLSDETFDAYTLPEAFRAPTDPLVISELALRPANFVELFNRGQTPIDLDDYSLSVAGHGPGQPWPTLGQGRQPALPPGQTLAPGERVVINLTAADTSGPSGNGEFEGVVTLFLDADPVDRVDFMQWPDGAVLVRIPDGTGGLHYCRTGTPGTENQCDALPSRDVGNRIRYLRTPGDLAALSAGTAQSGVESAKVVIDLDAGNVVHLLSASRWPLHYTFVRERIYNEPELDRCDPRQLAEFNGGWSAFSQTEYFQVEGRRFLLGTLSHYPGPQVRALEYTFGDRISPEQMRHGFMQVARHMLHPERWVLRVQDTSQLNKARSIEGTVPLVGPNAPFIGIQYQGLTEGIGYGTLRFVPAAELDHAALGQRVIVLTDEVPNDIPFVGGLITEAFQTPLAHVNILSQGRNTPNMALVDGRNDMRVAPFIDRLVRLEVTSGGFKIDVADTGEAEAFWQSQIPDGPTIAPRSDFSVTDLIPLEGTTGLSALPAVGAKAAQLGELARVPSTSRSCGSALNTPTRPFAIPLAHYADHFERSGAKAFLQSRLAAAEFRDDGAVRARDLAEAQRMIMETPVEPTLLDAVDRAVAERFAQGRVRFRSSSNTEDLPGFNGAGIYTSISAERGDPDRTIEDAMRTVWASLWNERAFDERSFARIDHGQVAMGILVHNAFLSERANGVGISRNVLNPDRGDQHYYNLQFGEASVTNPAPGVSTETLLYQLPPRTPALRYQGASSLAAGHVMQEEEIELLACQLSAIHAHFQPLIDPQGTNSWFAMDTEFKVMGGARQLIFKQARPYSFGSLEPVGDCREF